MRKSKQESALTRERIVETASAVFRKNGIDRTGISDLMSSAGLTHGGFYKHFGSKDELVAEASAHALTEAVRNLDQSKASRSAMVELETLAREYLHLEDSTQSGAGCLFAMLGSELARADDRVRGVATSGLDALLQRFAQQMHKISPDRAELKAMAALSTMVGALTLSRIVVDDALRASLLAEAVQTVKTIAHS